MRRIVWLALAVVGCGHPPGPQLGSAHATPPADAAPAVVEPPAPTPLDRDLPRLALQGVKLFEDIVRELEASGEDCSAAATRLDHLHGQYGEVTTANAKVLHDGRARDLKQALAPYDERFEAAAKAIAGSKTLHDCANDAAFAHAFDELVGAP